MRGIGELLFLMTILFVAESSAETKTLSFKDFDGVTVGYGMRVSISQGETYRVEATGASGDLQRLKVKQIGDRLQFWMESGWGRWLRSGRISLDITLPKLRRLDLSGGSQGTFNMQIGSERFSADVSGGSSVHGQLICGDVDLSLSGGSRADLSGAGERLRLVGSGGSRFDAENFSASDLRATLSGGSRATVNLHGEVRAALSGGSRVIYYGAPTLASVDASGGSRVQKGR